MPMSMVSAKSETLTALPRIWTQATDSIFDDDNRYTIQATLFVLWA